MRAFLSLLAYYWITVSDATVESHSESKDEDSGYLLLAEFLTMDPDTSSAPATKRLRSESEDHKVQESLSNAFTVSVTARGIKYDLGRHVDEFILSQEVLSGVVPEVSSLIPKKFFGGVLRVKSGHVKVRSFTHVLLGVNCGLVNQKYSSDLKSLLSLPGRFAGVDSPVLVLEQGDVCQIGKTGSRFTVLPRLIAQELSESIKSFEDHPLAVIDGAVSPACDPAILAKYMFQLEVVPTTL